jgi:effector-binding domain-containing protein
MAVLDVLVTIGDFSRMTHLSVKALRHYHDVGVLTPAQVDTDSGYRLYDASQVPVAHLVRMESQLSETQSTVASLRALLERPTTPIVVEYRSVPALSTLAITEPVTVDELEEFWVGAFEELYGAFSAAGREPAGPGGALYPNELFELEKGEVVVFVPVAGDIAPTGRATPFEIPAAELAVTVHEGSFAQLDQAYGALRTYVAERELGVEGPIREHYLVTYSDTEDESQHRTEVCWPVFHTTPATPPPTGTSPSAR